MVGLDTFLAPVISQVLESAEIVQREDREIVKYDPIVAAWARNALAAAEGYCKRPLYYTSSVTDRYNSVNERRIDLRVTPVDEITSVRIIGSDTDLSTDSYSLDADTLVIGAAESYYSTFWLLGYDTDDYNSETVDLRVTYSGGYKRADSDRQLLTALTAQTLLWYRQRDIQAFSAYTSGKSREEQKMIIALSSLNEEVKNMLNKFRYLGFGYEGR